MICQTGGRTKPEKWPGMSCRTRVNIGRLMVEDFANPDIRHLELNARLENVHQALFL